jgi:hypothetical protein
MILLWPFFVSMLNMLEKTEENIHYKLHISEV